jgi:phage gpG-like protein
MGDGAAALFRACARMQNFEPLYRTIGRFAVHSIRRNFFESLDPVTGSTWPALKKPRGKGRNPGTRPLLDALGLYESVDYEVIDDHGVRVGYSAKHGRFHNMGTRFIPRRRFLGLRREDREPIEQAARDHLRDSFR